jgi:GT2 family glycosyltransferase/glycosyltransferase involved in cell wall biosynthesis
MIIHPKVSVILTSYNSAKYLRESIESALNQTYRNFELIIWFDESTDDSLNIISGYADARIRVFRNESNRFVAHFQRAISDVAQGEYIAIHHSDDIWEADKLEKQVFFLDEHPEIGAVFSQVLVIGENSEPFDDISHFYYKVFDQPNRTRYEWLNHFFYQGNALCHPSVLIRKVCFNDCGLYRYGLAQANDLDMWVRLCLKYEIYVLPEKLVRFRVRANEMNASGNRPDAYIRGAFDLFQILANYRSIKDAEEFMKIFPNAGKYIKQNDFDINFALGMMALDLDTPNYAKLFGLQLLFEALNDPERAKKIKELYQFSYTDFFALAGTYDVFSTVLIPNLSAQVDEKERTNQRLLSQLHARNLEMVDITSSITWSILRRLRQIRSWIAPAGGMREKLLRLIFQGLRIWKNEGIHSVYRKVIQKIKLRFSVGHHRAIIDTISDKTQKDIWAEALLDMRTLSQVHAFPLSYDVIILPINDWHFQIQGLQQIARHFGHDGHRVFYVSPTFKKTAKTIIRPIEDGIFEVQLQSSGSVDIHSDSADGQISDIVGSAFDALRYEFGVVDAICILDLPFWKPIAFTLRDNYRWKIIYDCTGFQPESGNDVEEVLHEKDDLIRKSDLVLATSPTLFNELEKLNPNCMLAHNVADEAHFHQVSPNERRVSIEKVLHDDTLERVADHMGFVAQNPWDDRYVQIKHRIPLLFAKASIIIVTYNNVEYTRLCLKSIFERTIYPNFEVIVVDNASADGTPEFLNEFEAEHENIRIIYNASNDGFARANNLGIAQATGDYIVLLNNDTIVTRVWLSKLLDHLVDQQVGLVGSVTNGVSNEAYVEMQFTDTDGLDVFASKLARERANILTPIKVLAMYCVAGRKDVFQQIGPLDEQFGIGMFEDDDYSLRIRQAGYRIAVAEDVFIHHFGRSGFKILGDELYLALFEENRRKFEAKWNVKWEQHISGTLTENRRLTADLQNILNAYPNAQGVVIFPPTIGWNINLFQRPHQLARAFSNKGFLVFFHTEAQVDDISGFKQVAPGLYLVNSPWAVFDLVERPVVFALPYNREYLFQLRQPTVVYEVIDDLDVFPGDKSRLQKNHDILLKEADIVLVTADGLMEQVDQIRPDAIMCPNAVELDHFSGARWDDKQLPIPADLGLIIKADRPVIGYYGALARWFDYELVGRAAQKHPDWDFVLIGPDHDHTLIGSNILSISNIHWLGARDYSQLPNYLHHFTVATIPFLVNNITLATSPIKLFEYMAAGKPIVTSDMPECRKYSGVLVAHNANEYISHLEYALTLANDSAYLQQLYQIAQENTWEVRVRQIVDALEMCQNRK